MCLRFTYYLTQIRAPQRAFNQKGPTALTSRGVIQMASCSRSSIFRLRASLVCHPADAFVLLCRRVSGSRTLPNRKSETPRQWLCSLPSALPRFRFLFFEGLLSCYFFHKSAHEYGQIYRLMLFL